MKHNSHNSLWRIIPFGAAGALVLGACTLAPETTPATATPDCDDPDQARSVHCGRTPSTTFDPDGRLWAAYVVDEQVYVSQSSDGGRQFSPPIAVNATPEPIYTNGENRPKIAFGPEGELYLSWSKVTEGRFNGDVRFTRSLDGGETFEPPRTLNDDGLVTGHRFDALHVNEAGDIFLTWLDKRDEYVAKAAGDDYPGAAVYYTVSTDRGAHFAANRKVADHSCECCRIATAPTPDGDKAIFWRHIFGDALEYRDHGFAVLGRDQVVSPVDWATDDDWRLDGCPHHGPDMAPTGGDAYHVTWFTLGDNRRGVFYGLYDARAQAMQQVTPVAGAGASHPAIASLGDRLWLVWKQYDGERTAIQMIHSTDGGESWRDAQALAHTDGGSDHPLLITHDDQVWLSWHTEDEGLRLITP